jgi:hypothetical protein
MRLLKPVLLAIVLCKTLVMLRVSGLIEPSQLHMPGYVVVLDLVLLPLHFFFAAVASMAGAALSKRLIPAIGGAVVFALAASFAILYTQVTIMSETNARESEFTMLFLTSHVVLIGIACLISLAVADGSLISLWNDQAGGGNRTSDSQTPLPPPQPPNLPK